MSTFHIPMQDESNIENVKYQSVNIRLLIIHLLITCCTFDNYESIETEEEKSNKFIHALLQKAVAAYGHE